MKLETKDRLTQKEAGRKKKASTLEIRLQSTLDYMIEGCQIIGYDWRYLYVNESAARQGRKPKQELIGVEMTKAYPGINKTEMFHHLQNCMINRVPLEMDNEFTFPDGSKGWFELHIEPVPEGILILSKDINKQKTEGAELNKYRDRLEAVVAQRTAECTQTKQDLKEEIQAHQKTEEGLKLRVTILDNAKEAIFLVSPKGDFAYANEAASKMYGRSLDEFLNLSLHALMPPEDAPSVEKLMLHVLEKGQTSLEMVHIRKDNSPIKIKLYANTVKTHRGQFIVLLIRENYE
jgi:PAS domain S-box-containing protein